MRFKPQNKDKVFFKTVFIIGYELSLFSVSPHKKTATKNGDGQQMTD